MKEVKITINGDLLVIDYCSKSLIKEEDSFIDQYYAVSGWDKVNAMYIDDNTEENVVKKKGKYVKSVTFFHERMDKNSEHPLPVEMHTRRYYDIDADYVIELEDNEEFDIKKVQLVKSDYELPEFPYFICANNILYDGKEIPTYDTDEFCPEEKCYNEFTVSEFYNGEPF